MHKLRNACALREQSLNVWISVTLCVFLARFLNLESVYLQKTAVAMLLVSNIYLTLHKAQNGLMMTKYVQTGSGKVEPES